jgi:hypothetical protein
MKYFEWQIAAGIAAVVAVATGTFAVTGVVIACTCMVRETRLAVQYLGEEAEVARLQDPELR